MRTGLVDDHPRLDSRWEEAKDDRRSADMADLELDVHREADHRPVGLAGLGVVAPRRPCGHSLPPSCVPSILFGSP